MDGYGTNPWAYAAVSASIIVALVLVGLIMRKRRQRHAKFGPARIIGPPSIAGHRDVHGIHSGRVGQRVGRWGWTPNRTAPLADEGLNELGEAPPPYAGDDVEMQAQSAETRTTAAGGGDGNRLAQVGAVAPVVVPTENQHGSQELPPAYGETPAAPPTAIHHPANEDTVSRMGPIAAPPAAVLPSYRPSYT